MWRRLVRYGISGGASALTHFGVGLTLVEVVRIRPVVASSVGFAASIVVSYLLQRIWVFQSTTGHVVAGAKFLVVTAIAFALNAVILWLGAEVMRGPYPVVQSIALVAIPAVNYSLNSRWTFRGAPRRVADRRGG
ncbi:GtrA family protein [Actinoplanes sp. NPDC049596]|uniref:GtrA family protein n=1 Tax=unclassified Actinoplanes TaxID=2626549 RepID=UPI003419B924